MSFYSRLFDELEQIEPNLFILLRGPDARRELEQIMLTRRIMIWTHAALFAVIVVVTLVQEFWK